MVALAVFVVMWIGYSAGWRWLDALDQWALAGAYSVVERHPGWVTFWDVWCTVFGPGVFRVVIAGLIIAALVRRNVRVAVLLLLTVELSGVVTQAAKWVADRPRPDTATVAALGTSFPSGHALAVAAVGVTVMVLVGTRTVGRTVTLAVLVTVIVLSVGYGRVALNVHHPSDVLAGWALGYAYATICVWVVYPPRVRARCADAGDTPVAPDTAR